MADFNLKDQMLARAKELGFMDLRVTGTQIVPPAVDAYGDWLTQGYHGEMAYMANHKDERSQGVEHILPGAKSVIVLAASYYFPDKTEEPLSPTQTTVRVARYALGQDYHYVLKDRLNGLIDWLDAKLPGHAWRPCVDSAPLLERTYAAQAGIGFIGKNAMIISWMAGSYTFLAEILTTADLEPDPPRPGTCGNCTRCLDSCPTQAFISPGVLDARRCLSYLTIEKRTELTPEESAATGEWVFGCDICQDVCPYNKRPEHGTLSEFRPGTILNLKEDPSRFLASPSNRQFDREFQGSPILRTGKKRLQNLVRKKLLP